MNREFRKIFVTSRHRWSGTGSNFVVELNDSVELPDGWSAWVTRVTVPNSWYTVTSGQNDKLYVMERNPLVIAGYVLTIPEGLYSHDQLASAIQAQLAGASPFGHTCVANGETLTVTSGDPDVLLKLPSRFELSQRWWKVSVWDGMAVAPSYDPSEPSDLNFMISTGLTSPDYGASFTSGIVDLSPHNVLYLHGSFGTYSTIDTAGRRGIFCSVLVDVPYGALIHEEHGGLSEDSIDVSNARFRNITLSLRNCYGQVVDLRGGDITVEICLGPTK